MTTKTAPARLAALLGGLPAPGGPHLGRLLGGMLWRQRRRTLPALAAAAALSIIAFIPPWLIARLIDEGFVGREAGLVIGIAGLILVFGAIDGALACARRLLAAQATLELRRELLVPAFGTMLRLPADSGLARDQGVLGRSFEEVDRLAQGAGDRLAEFALGFGTAAILLGAMLAIDWRIGLAAGALLAVLAALHLAAAATLRQREAGWFDARSRYWAHLIEAVAYVETLRRNSAHAFAEDRFRERLDRDNDAHLAVVRLSAGLDAAGRFAGGAIIATVTLLAGSSVISGEASIGTFVLLLSIGGALTAPALSALKVVDDLQAMIVAAACLRRLAAPPHEDVEGALAPGPALTEALAVSGLTFSYGPQDQPVIDRLSFSLAPGETLALLGRSGIGKSTLANLLIRARQGEGEIRLGTQTSAEIPLGIWRRRIVVVPHEIDIFTGSIAENIALSAPDAGREAIVMAATLAGLADDIAGLPAGYDTGLGQDGVELSAGQKQRLGLARTMFFTPDVLILDESTSALDAATERRVLDTLLQRHAGAAVLAITHRDSVAARMGRVLRLDGAPAVSEETARLRAAAEPDR